MKKPSKYILILTDAIILGLMVGYKLPGWPEFLHYDADRKVIKIISILQKYYSISQLNPIKCYLHSVLWQLGLV